MNQVMNRFILLVLGMSLFAVGPVSAGDNVSDVQTKLKEGGFYFGAIDGALSSDLSAALTRYQIRHGLQITGNLNEETSKSLGVKPEVAASNPPAAPNGDTWRRLRKSDQQFLSKMNERPGLPAGSNSANKPRGKPAGAGIAPDARRRDNQLGPPSSNAPTAALVPARTGDSSTVILSPERLRDYVGAFVLAGLDPKVGSELEFFGDRVRYYDDGVVDRRKIRGDLERYDALWPGRRFWLAGNLAVEPQADSRLKVSFPLRFDLRNGSRHSTGKVQKTLLLEVTGEDLQIVAVNERKVR